MPHSLRRLGHLPLWERGARSVSRFAVGGHARNGAKRMPILAEKIIKDLTNKPCGVANRGPREVWEAACHAGLRGVPNAIHAVEKLQYKMQASPPKHAYTDCNTSTPAKTRQPSQMPVPVGKAHLFPLSAMGIAAAEREGFEPSVTSLPRSISSRVP